MEDTLIGIRLPAFHRSVRKSVKLQPKFYLFDLGIKRAMAGELGNAIVSRSHAYGNAFEHFLVCEIFRLNSYLRKDFSISHYQTTAGGEVDLVLHKANHVIALEIKSNSKVDLTEVHKLEKVSGALTPNQIFYLSQDPFRQKVKGVECLHWKEFLTEFFV